MRKTAPLLLALLTAIALAAASVAPPEAVSFKPPICAPVDAKQLTRSQVRCFVEQAGWKGAKAGTATKIAMLESGGKPGAKGINGALGLFQIDRDYWKISKWCARDALCNADYAHDKIYKKHGFGAWYGYEQIKR